MGTASRTARRAVAAALIAAALLPGGRAAGTSAGEGNPDAPVLRRIAEVRERAGRIRVDGNPADWKGIPSFEDADPAPLPDRSRDIVRVSVAPREGDVLVLVETAGAPSRAAEAFGLDVDFLGASANDFILRFGATGPISCTLLPEGEPPRAGPVDRIEVAVAEAVEIRVPLSLVATALGPSCASSRGRGNGSTRAPRPPPSSSARRPSSSTRRCGPTGSRAARCALP